MSFSTAPQGMLRSEILFDSGVSMPTTQLVLLSSIAMKQVV
jgi:hypothetical protein